MNCQHQTNFYPSTHSLWIESYAQLESLIREVSRKKENIEAEKTESEAQDGTQNNGNVDEQEDIGEIKFASFSKEKLYDFLAATISKETYPNATVVLSDLSSTDTNEMKK